MKAALALALVMAASLVPAAWAQVEADYQSFGASTIVTLSNQGSELVKALVFKLDAGQFQSLEAPSGWEGVRQSGSVVSFTASVGLAGGESAKFGLVSSSESPPIKWTAIGPSGSEVGSGVISPAAAPDPVEPDPVAPDPVEPDPVEPEQPQLGVMPESDFRIVPDRPHVGSSIRIVGSSFGPGQPLAFYLGTDQLGTFEAGPDGSFVGTAAISESAAADRVTFTIQDESGAKKDVSIRLGQKPVPKTQADEQVPPLTIDPIPEANLGESLDVSGSWIAGEFAIVSIRDPSGGLFAVGVAEAGYDGRWSYSALVPENSDPGTYSALASTGLAMQTSSASIKSVALINVVPTKLQFEPGEPIVFRGTAVPNVPIEAVIINSLRNEVYSDIISTDDSGRLEISLPTAPADKKGTYVLSLKQGGSNAVVPAGLGELPSEQLFVETDKLNYPLGSKMRVTIDGPSATEVEIIILDSSDKSVSSEKARLGPNGNLERTLSLDGLKPGTYTLVVKYGGDEVPTAFAIGLGTDSGPISLQITRTEYLPGELINLYGTVSSKKSILLNLKLIDPDGSVIRDKDVLVKQGKIIGNSLRIPHLSQPGTWTVTARGGSLQDSVEISVVSAMQEGMRVMAAIEGPSYDRSLKIRGSGATVSQTISITLASVLAGENVGDPFTTLSTGNGDFSYTWPVPKSLLPGNYTVTASGPAQTAVAHFEVK